VTRVARPRRTIVVVTPSSFRNLRALERLNVAGVGLSLAGAEAQNHSSPRCRSRNWNTPDPMKLVWLLTPMRKP